MTLKIPLLMPLLWSRPVEFFERIGAVVDSRSEQYLGRAPAYQGQPLNDAIGAIDQQFGWTLAEYMAEDTCQAHTASIARAITNLPADAPFSRLHNSDFTLAQTAYALCRALKPRMVVETGVAYGVTSSFILAALKQNQAGELYSIDLPPLGTNADDFVGRLVPYSLRLPWHLIRGTSRRLLPTLANHLAPIDLFIHDSLHTHRNITFELETVQPYLSQRAAVLVDDAGLNSAFADWQQRSRPQMATIVREEKEGALFGVAVLGREA